MTELERCRGEYLNHLTVERNLAANTIAAYERDLRAYLAFLGERGTRRPDDVIRRDVEDFVAAKRADHAADASVNRALSAVKGFHRFMVREGLSSVNPTATLRVPKMGDHLPDVISIEAAERLLDQDFPATAAGMRDRAVLEVLYGCGLRASELCGLDANEVYLDEGFVRVMGKGSKERLVPLVGTARRVLGTYLAEARSELFSHHAIGFGVGRGVLEYAGHAPFASKRPCDLRALRPYGRDRWAAPAHPSTLLRNAYARRRCGPACPAGDLGACGYRHNADLHSCRPHAAARGLSGGASTRLGSGGVSHLRRRGLGGGCDHKSGTI